MSDERITVRVCINFPSKEGEKTETLFFRYDEYGDTFEITDSQMRQLLLQQGSLVDAEFSFEDGHETRDAVPLLDTLHSARSALYAREEPSTDPELEGIDHDHFDVVLYEDKEATRRAARYPWYFEKSKPKPDQSIITHNCATRYLIWLPRLPRTEKALALNDC